MTFRCARVLLVTSAMAVLMGCASDHTPTPTAPSYTPPAIDCSLVGDLPCQQPAPTLCLDHAAANFGQALPCSYPPPPVTPTPQPTPAPQPDPKPRTPDPFELGYVSVPSTVTAGDSNTFAVGWIGAVGPVSIQWTFSDGFTSTAQSFAHVFAAIGPASFTVTINDTATSDTYTKNYNVLSPLLVVSLSCNPAAHGTPTTCAVGAAYQNASATITSVDWVWGDGVATTEGAIANHTYANASAPTFTATATVHATTSGGAKTGSASTSVTIP